MSELRVLIVSADSVSSSRLGKIIETIAGVDFSVHHCSSKVGALCLASYYGPAAVFVDDDIQEWQEIIANVKVESPRTAMLLLTEADGRQALGRALSANARDYLCKRDLNRRVVERCLWGLIATHAGLLPETATGLSVGGTRNVQPAVAG